MTEKGKPGGGVMILEHVRAHGHGMVFPDESMTVITSHRHEHLITIFPFL